MPNNLSSYNKYFVHDFLNHYQEVEAASEGHAAEIFTKQPVNARLFNETGFKLIVCKFTDELKHMLDNEKDSQEQLRILEEQGERPLYFDYE